jgi:hypothetical protein
MKILLLLTALLCSSLLSSCAGPLSAAGPGDGARQRAVIAAEQRRVDALTHNDIAALEPILADELTYSHSTGENDTKTAYLRKLTSGRLRYKSMEHSDERVRLYGDTAILTGMTRVDSVLDGLESRPFLNFLTVYVWRDDAWRLVAWHSTRMPDAAP